MATQHLWAALSYALFVLQGVLIAVLAVLASVGTLILLVWIPGLFAVQKFEDVCETSVLFHPALLIVGLLNLPFPAVPAIWMVSVAGTPHLRSTAFFATLNWFANVQNVMEVAAHCEQGNFFNQDHWQWLAQDVQVTPLGTVGNISFVLLIALFLGNNALLIQRMWALESTAMQDFGLRASIKTLFFLIFVVACARTLLMEWSSPWLDLLVAGGVMSTSALYGIMIVSTLARARRALGKAAEKAPQREAILAGQARVALRMQAIALAGTLSCSFLGALTQAVSAGDIHVTRSHSADDWKRNLAFRIILNVDADMAALLALSLSGALSGAAKGAVERARSDHLRRQRWRSHRADLRQQRHPVKQYLDCAEPWQKWDEKVRDLAGRGISLRALLDFYRHLPLEMPHFDPELHTTCDIVRQVIIPLSKENKSALSTVLMENQRTEPDMMVTHNWGNRFRDLMAAVCADALEETDFTRICDLLMSGDLDLLEHWIEKRGRLDRAYWVCAFAVNQHLGICTNEKPRADPATGELEPGCNCCLERAWNNTPPLLPDGRSVPCEMNKFDDMMAYLSSKNREFGQVVAVDAGFKIFSRAWCIAEIAEANQAGMVQCIKIASPENLSRHEGELRELRIQDMQAARESDKEHILASIKDHEAFNLRVRRLLFEDLLPSWSSLDLAEQMSLAGCLIRWHTQGLAGV